MKAVIQRVKYARVSVDGEIVGSCDKGLFILLGVVESDNEEDIAPLAAKIAKLRIFSDENGKMNLSLNDVGGSALVVSNFTLCANYKHGNRPDYLSAKNPDEANSLYMLFCEKLRELVKGTVQTGSFGADMQIELCADGPVTIVMDSEVLKK